MKWFLVVTVIHYVGGGDTMATPVSSSTVKIEMPSEDICNQIKTLNKFMNAECWATKGE